MGGRNWRIVALGCGLWCLATAAQWPIGPSFRDEVGYIGQSRIEMKGAMRPRPDAVCYAFRTIRGEIAEYPPVIPTLLIPFVAISPRLAFGLGVLSALLLVVATGRMLARWDASPVFGLAVLLHPTVIMMSRTAMGDLLLAAAAVSAWNALSRSHAWRTAAWFGLLVAVKPTGVIVAGALIGGSWLAQRANLVNRDGSRLRAGSVGAGAGLVVVALMNLAATGGLQYATVLSDARFGASFFATSGWRHLVTLLLIPPGLGAGAVPLWKRREYGALLASATLVIAMTFYYFVDSGRTSWETLVLAPRLILPSVAILSVGWLTGISRWVPRRANTLGAVVLLAGCVVAPTALGTLHRRWQEPMRVALASAETQLTLQDSHLLGVSTTAFKAGVMSRSAIVAVDRDVPNGVLVVLCSAEGESYRNPAPGVTCAFPGFTPISASGPYRVLVREH